MSVEQCVAEFRKFLDEAQASARNEGINYAASRLAAAFNHGFLDKPVSEVLDVTRMILSAKEDLANDPLPAADGLSGEYAEKSIEEWVAQLRQEAAQ
ncbi:Eae protein [Salmonella enterica subsp. enterica serovar Madelia]